MKTTTKSNKVYHEQPFDNSNLTPEKYNQLVKEYRYLVQATISKRFRNAREFLNYHGLGMDDINQYGLIGLSKAIKNYDPTRNTEFITHAIYYIYGYINSYAKKDSLYNKNTQTFDLIESTSLDKEETEDSKFTRDAVEIQLIQNNWDNEGAEDLIEGLRGRVPDRLIYIMQEKLKGYSNSVIAKNLGITRQAVEQQLKLYKELVTNLVNAS